MRRKAIIFISPHNVQAAIVGESVALEITETFDDRMKLPVAFAKILEWMDRMNVTTTEYGGKWDPPESLGSAVCAEKETE